MTEEKFKQYRDYFNNLLVFSDNENKLNELTRQLPQIYQTAIGIFSDQLKETKDTMTMRDETYGKLYKKFKDNHNRNYTTKEIDIMIKADPLYKKIAYDLNNQEMYLDYMKQTIDNIKSIQWNVKNYMDIKKFYTGDY